VENRKDGVMKQLKDWPISKQFEWRGRSRTTDFIDLRGFIPPSHYGIYNPAIIRGSQEIVSVRFIGIHKKDGPIYETEDSRMFSWEELSFDQIAINLIQGAYNEPSLR